MTDFEMRDDTERGDEAAAGDADRDSGAPGAQGDGHVQLLDAAELQDTISNWKEIQAHFVDDPRSALKDADRLVIELMRRLSEGFAVERDKLESQWVSGDDVSTEDLRQNLQRYRSFFDRLLAA